MLQGDLFSVEPLDRALDLPRLIERLSRISKRPRYAFIVLNLIAKVADAAGHAGPFVSDTDGEVPLRDWLCDALVPIARRDARRLAIVHEVREELRRTEVLPEDAAAAAEMTDEAVRERVRRSGRTNVSRAVTDLVRAGLVRRHYAGYAVDHHNRGAQRQAVYGITEEARRALRMAA